jgi:hypothetical protein
VSRTRVDPRRAKLHRSYTVEETSRLFAVHRNTVRAWLKAGLPTIDDAKPALIRGADLRRFLDARRKAARRPCAPGTLYCFACRASRAPALGMADFIAREGGAGNLRALCEACGTTMHRRTRQDTLDAILPGIAVRVMGGEGRIAEWPQPSPKCAERRPETA